ncbi:MAG: hypothetical protein ACN4GR_16300 [Arenicellales bacterium]
MKLIEPEMYSIMNSITRLAVSTYKAPVFTDEWIERCALIYKRRHISNYGIPFFSFVEFPRQVLVGIRQRQKAKAATTRLIDQATDQMHKLNQRPGHAGAQEIRLCGCQLVQPMHPRRPVSKKRIGRLH